MKDSNFTKVSNLLVRRAKHLGITHFQFRLIVTVEMHARKERLPYPSSKTVAEIMGVSERKVQRVSEGLQEKGYLKRPKGGLKPYWDFTGLFEALEKVVTPTTGAGVRVSTNTDNLHTEQRQFGHATPTNPLPNTDNGGHPKKTIEEDIKNNIKKTPYGSKERDSNLSSQLKNHPVPTNKIEQLQLSTNEKPDIDEVLAAYRKWLDSEESLKSDEAQTSLDGDKLVKPSENEN